MLTIIKKYRSEKGYTILELVIYMALMGAFIALAVNVAMFVYRTNSKIVAAIDVNSTAYSAIERMVYEIENSQSIYMPTSNFFNYNYNVAKSQQLSLVTAINAPANETDSYLDFYVENNTLFLKKDGANPIALTPSTVSVSALSFGYYKNGDRESIKIDMTLVPANSTITGTDTHLITTTALRSIN